VDRGEARHAVQELYARRFEPLRMFYGVDGALDAGPALSEAVAIAGTRLQELMRLLAADASDAAMIEEAVRASQDALDQVESAARAAGLPPTAPRDTAVSADASPADTAGQATPP